MARERGSPGYPEAEQEQPIAETERSIDQEMAELYLEVMLSEYRKFDEGNDGIVGIVDTSRFEPEFLDRLTKDRVEQDPPDELALKILKICSHPSAAKREAALQQAAFVALRDAESGVRVPQVYYADQVQITHESIRENLRSQGVRLSPEHAVGMVMMDVAEGEDFATYLYKEIATMHPKLRDLGQMIQEGGSVQISELIDRVSQALDFHTPKNQFDDFQQRRIANENQKRIVDFLYENGFVLNEDFLQALRRGITALNKAGIRHNDLHERNIMGVVDAEGAIASPTIIDYGRSTKSGAFEQGKAEGALDDMYVYHAYKRLTIPREERKKKQDLGVLQGAEHMLGGPNREAYEALRHAVADEARGTSVDAIVELVDGFVVETGRVKQYADAERYWRLACSIFHELAEEHPALAGAFSAHLEQQLKENRFIKASLPAQRIVRSTMRLIAG